MVAVYKKGTSELVTMGELLKDEKHFFSIHSGHQEYSKKDYEYKSIP